MCHLQMQRNYVCHCKISPECNCLMVVKSCKKKLATGRMAYRSISELHLLYLGTFLFQWGWWGAADNYMDQTAVGKRDCTWKVSCAGFGSCKVPRVLWGPFKSLELCWPDWQVDVSIKGLLSPLIQPMDPFHCCEFRDVTAWSRPHTMTKGDHTIFGCKKCFHQLILIWYKPQW